MCTQSIENTGSPIKEFKLISSGKYVNDMYVLGCEFYITKHENIYITDYDCLNKYPNSENDLRKKGVRLLIYIDKGHKKHQYFNAELLNDADSMNELIDRFYNEITKNN